MEFHRAESHRAALRGTDVTPQVIPMGIGRSAASQVSGECRKWKDWRRE